MYVYMQIYVAKPTKRSTLKQEHLNHNTEGKNKSKTTTAEARAARRGLHARLTTMRKKHARLTTMRKKHAMRKNVIFYCLFTP